jgi:hypothetical protein
MKTLLKLGQLLLLAVVLGAVPRVLVLLFVIGTTERRASLCVVSALVVLLTAGGWCLRGRRREAATVPVGSFDAESVPAGVNPRPAEGQGEEPEAAGVGCHSGPLEVSSAGRRHDRTRA